MLGSFGRRRSHPIKIANLAATTQRLCSNAGHQMEMEYEDLNIISDSRRHNSSSAAKKPKNKNKNRYVNIFGLYQCFVHYGTNICKIQHWHVKFVIIVESTRVSMAQENI